MNKNLIIQKIYVSKGLFKNVKKEAKWVRFYKNGQLFSVSNYNMGRKMAPGLPIVKKVSL